jgi:hypothetical protein
MMSKIEAKAATASPSGSERASPQPEVSAEDRSKDAFFARVADVANAMIAAHGKEFAIGTMVLAAKFIAEDKPFANQDSRAGQSATADERG